MLNTSNLFVFLFVWSILVSTRTLAMAISAVFSKEPKPMKLTKSELLLNSITLSYIITYLVIK